MKGLKLSNKQVEVLAEEIYKELEVEANKYKETEEYKNFEQTLKNDEEYKAWKKLEKAMKTAVSDKIINQDKWYYSDLINGASEYSKKKRKEQYPSPSIPSKQSISNKIHLNTIDVDNLEDLINKVKDSLKN